MFLITSFFPYKFLFFENIDFLENDLDEVDSLEDESVGSKKKVSFGREADLAREEKIKRLTQEFGVPKEKSPKIESEVEKTGKNLLTEVDHIKKRQQMKRFKDLEAMNQVAGDQGKHSYPLKQKKP
jgi:hypothetical protein